MNPQASGAGITIRLNGEARTCPDGLNLEQVLIALGFQPRLVVVEVDGTIVPRRLWPHHQVRESAVLEVVTIVGGGS
jgi:sulfur carrier protein